MCIRDSVGGVRTHRQYSPPLRPTILFISIINRQEVWGRRGGLAAAASKRSGGAEVLAQSRLQGRHHLESTRGGPGQGRQEDGAY